MVLVLARESHFACFSMGGGGGEKQPLFYSDNYCSHIFSENVLRNFNYLEAAFGALLCVV
jgi:hypothetical protein